ncbi:MAG: DUF2516 family protein [Nocardioides sp.]
MPRGYGFHSRTELFIVNVEIWFLIALAVALVALKAYALFHAVRFSTESYPAADKLTKLLWVLILVFSFLTAALYLWADPYHPRPHGLIQLIFTIATLIFVCDVKPALEDLRR